MEEVEIEGTFDSEDTAFGVARAVNRWFAWANEGNFDDVPDVFEDFGIDVDDFNLEDTEIDWGESPYATARGNMVLVRIETGETLDLIQELIETLGAYDVNVNEDVGESDRVVDDDEEDESSSKGSASAGSNGESSDGDDDDGGDDDGASGDDDDDGQGADDDDDEYDEEDD